MSNQIYGNINDPANSSGGQGNGQPGNTAAPGNQAAAASPQSGNGDASQNGSSSHQIKQETKEGGEWKPSHDGVAGDVETNVHGTGEALSKAKQAMSGFLSGDANIVDAAMAVKGAFDAVTQLSGQLSASLMMPVMKALGPFKGQAILPAARQMDPMMGIDVHMVTIPPSPAPVPMPHPYVGMLFNAKDWVSVMVNTFKKTALDALPPPAEDDKSVMASVAENKEAIASIAMGLANLGASVKFGDAIPRAITGTPVKSVPHIPMGAGFHPAFQAAVEKNNGKAFLGSLFVLADGDPMMGSFHLNYDCWDVGVVDLFKALRGKGKMKQPSPPEPGAPKAELFAPTGTVMPIPGGRPVLVNSIPTPINPLALLDKLFKAGLGKLMKVAKKAAANVLHGLVGKLGKGGAASQAAHRAICFVTGHPVDVVSGRLFTDEEDFSLPGVIPFSWERVWYSDSTYDGPLGYGWHHSYDIGFVVDVENNTAGFRMNDGRIAVFDLPLPGKSTYNRAEKLQLHFDAANNFYFIADAKGWLYKFTGKIYKNAASQSECHLIQSISNRNGYAIRFEYTNDGFLSKMIDSAGRILLVENDATGRIKTIKAPHPQAVGQIFPIAQYEYNQEGDMICHTDAIGGKMKYEYSNHLLIKETWRDRQEWHFRYDGSATGAKCIHTWGENGVYDHKLTYNPGITIVENSLGYLTTYYCKGSLLSKKIDANGAEWLYYYNENNELQWETDPLGNQQSYSYDDWGNIIATTDPGGGFTKTEYFNPKFPLLPSAAMDAAGGKWKWEYDEQGNLVAKTNPLGAQTTYEYDDGLLVKITNAADAVTQLGYDKDQNLISIETDDKAVTEYRYDELGNCTATINPNGVKQRRFFDLKGRIEKVNDFDSNVIYLDYDGIDNVVRYRDRQKEVEYTYRGLWKLTGRTEAGASIFFKYDTEEQLVRIINEKGLPYRFVLDPAGNVTEEIGFDGITRQYERNPAGWVTKVNRPGGKFTEYNYDDCGRVTGVLYSDNKQERYTYRPDGELIKAVNESAKVQFERNVSGDIVKETVNGEWVQSEYDIFSNRTKITSSLGANITHAYNNMGDVLQMEANGWFAKFEHDKLGLETNRLLPGGVSSNWQRDGIGRPVIQTVGHTANNIFNARKRKQYTWEVNDRLKQIKDEKGITSFEHDGWSNLAKTIYPDGEVQLRNPDAVGNLFKTIDRKDREYGKGGQLKKANGWSYGYDEEGNLIKKEHVGGDVWKYEWNDAGMLMKVIRPDNEEVSFSYDALGRRLSKQFKNTITKFVWDGNVLLHEWKEDARTGKILGSLEVNEDGDLSTSRIPGPERGISSPSGRQGGAVTWLFDTYSFAPTAKIKNGKTYSIVTDHLGTPGQMYKEDGELFWEAELDSYGKVRVEKGELGSCPFRYQGQYEDVETGLYYNRFRYYDPEACVYLSKDPIGLLGSNPNEYAYVSDPNTWIDVFGLDCSKAKSLKEWLKDDPDLLKEVTESYEKHPEWWGIHPEKDKVFYRDKTAVDAIRAKPGESGGHHPWGLALGGPEGQKLTITNETRTVKNPEHSAVTGLQRRVINVIKKQL